MHIHQEKINKLRIGQATGNTYFVLASENIFVFNHAILYTVSNSYNHSYKNIILCSNHKHLHCILTFTIFFIKIHNAPFIYKSKKIARNTSPETQDQSCTFKYMSEGFRWRTDINEQHRVNGIQWSRDVWCRWVSDSSVPSVCLPFPRSPVTPDTEQNSNGNDDPS